ncbi:MAG: long-chain-fatty-acid--CoA ligase [Chloroflexi bacterium]|nr:long-chain-fatty-acid--CoA ligase [Chloroflexota bacterium]
MTFADILDRTADKFPDKTAVSCDETILTYSQLRQRVNSLATSLGELGIDRGDRVAALAYDCHRYLELYLAAARAGFTLVPLNYRLVERELLFILQDCEPAALVAEDSFYATVDSLRPNLRSVRRYIGIGQARPGQLDYEDLACRSVSPSTEIGADDDVLCILYTSGTTGFPKGAMLTNRNLVANTLNVLADFGFRQDDINLVATPLFHTAALWPALTMVYLGGRSIIPKRFEVKRAFEIIERQKVTFFHPVQTQVISMIENPEIGWYDFSSLRCINVTLNLPLPAFRKALRHFGNVIVPGYGLTEASPMVTVLPQEEARGWREVLEKEPAQVPRYGSSGRVLPGVRIRVVDEHGKEVPAGEVGELLVKGDNVMKGYWNRPEINAAVLGEGWLHTGDMVRLDGDGNLYFVDRKSGMIKSGGENIYPKEVEDVISSHPGVLEVAVVGAPHEKWGETVKAIIVPRPEATLTEEEIVELCKKNLASYKKPTSIDFAECLPRSLSGKVAKNVLKQIYCNPG